MTIFRNVLLASLFLPLMFSCQKDEDTNIPNEPTVYEGWELVWNDEFDEPSINDKNWTFELGDGTDYGLQPGWGNNEQQIYTNSPTNVFITPDGQGNSVLAIKAIRTIEGNDTTYTSAKITTQGLQSFRFGRIEARMDLPEGQGIWPAFWMMGTNFPEIGWPGCGEIDIMEMLGSQEDTIHGNVHYVSDNNHVENLGTAYLSSGKYSDDYHLYTLEWSPESIKWLIDGVKFHEQAINEQDMKEYLRSFYLILNLAVGGYWPGYPDETTVFPQVLLVDYVRVYRNLSLDPPAAPALNIDEETMGAPSIDATAAINENFNEFESIKLIQYGGDVVELSLTDIAVDGPEAVKAIYPEAWAGIYFELTPEADLSAYAGGSVVAAVKMPEWITNFEIKLESKGGVGSLNLLDYPSIDAGNNFREFTIPLDDFVSLGLNLETITVPFALWNPMDVDGIFQGGEVIVDNIRFIK